MKTYFQILSEQFGRGWNQFWFAPSSASTLSLMRPVVGLLAVWWHWSYTADVLTFFGPSGLIRPELLAEWTGNAAGGGGSVTFSYFNWTQSASAIWGVHWLGFVVLLAFTVGFLTRLTTILGWIVVLSYIHRGPMLTSEFEPVLAMVMGYFAFGEFLSLFERTYGGGIGLLCGGICGSRFAVDQWLRKSIAAKANTILVTHAEPLALTSATITTRLVQVHLSAIYVMSAIGMLSSETWWAGEAVWWLVARPDQPSFFLARSLSDKPLLLNAWTHFIMFFQMLFGVFVWNQLARPLIVALAYVMWGLVALASGMYLFSAIMATATLVFVSPEWIERISPGSASLESRRETTATIGAVPAGRY